MYVIDFGLIVRAVVGLRYFLFCFFFFGHVQVLIIHSTRRGDCGRRWPFREISIG